MKRRQIGPLLRTCALVIAALTASATMSAQSLASAARPQAVEKKAPGRGLIWKVEGQGRQAWLVGSLHLLTPDFYPLPAALEQAFAASDVLMEEIDMADASDSQLAGAVLTKAMNPKGSTLSSQLSKETLTDLTAYLPKVGLTVDLLQAMKPWMVAITIQTLALQTAGFDPTFGIDKHFHDAAKRAGKRLLPLETAIEQLDFLDSLSPKTQDLMLRDSIRGAQTNNTEIAAIAAAWRSGDAAALEKLALSDRHQAPEVYETLLAGRNRRWIPKIEACMQANRSCYIVVGAAHLVGPDSVVALMQARGYTAVQH